MNSEILKKILKVQSKSLNFRHLISCPLHLSHKPPTEVSILARKPAKRSKTLFNSKCSSCGCIAIERVFAVELELQLQLFLSFLFLSVELSRALRISRYCSLDMNLRDLRPVWRNAPKIKTKRTSDRKVQENRIYKPKLAIRSELLPSHVPTGTPMPHEQTSARLFRTFEDLPRKSLVYTSASPPPRRATGTTDAPSYELAEAELSLTQIGR